MSGRPSQACLALVSLVLCAGCASPQDKSACAGSPVQAVPIPSAQLHYLVTLDKALQTATVQLCADPLPDPLVSGRKAFAAALMGARRDQAGPLSVEHGAIKTGGGKGCLHYVINLEQAVSAQGFRMELGRYGATLIAPPELWLWHGKRAPSEAVTVRFKLPKQVQVSVPWPLKADGSYRVPPTTWHYMIRCAFGPLQRRSLAVAGGTLEVASLGEPFSAGNAALDHYLIAAAKAASAPLGQLPAKKIQMLLVGVGGDAVHFGATARGGGAGIGLLIGKDVSPASLKGDWVGVHEMVHLLHPNLLSEDTWFYEGLATYYGPVLRARAGLITQAQAWAELSDGFQRGRGSVATGLDTMTLADESRQMRTRHSYWRVYWSGAAVMLQTDLELRRRSAGRETLDTFVRALWRSSRQDPWARSLAERLDKLPRALAALLRTNAKAALGSSEFPGLGAAYKTLGLGQAKESSEGGSANAEKLSTRARKIMSPDL